MQPPTQSSTPRAQRRIDAVTLRNSTNQQTAQIVENLRQRKHRIDQQESEFRLRVLNWESAAAQQQSELDHRKGALDQKEQRLRELQFQMLELQNQLIESQLALESIVAQVTQPATPQEPMLGLESLRRELFDRFDFVEQRWQVMKDDLHSVAEEIADAVSDTTTGLNSRTTSRIQLD